MNTTFKISILSLICLILMQIWVSHSLVNQGANLKKIEQLEKSLTQENLMLENAIATSSALFNIASASASLGFSAPRAVQYIR